MVRGGTILKAEDKDSALLEVGGEALKRPWIGGIGGGEAEDEGEGGLAEVTAGLVELAESGQTISVVIVCPLPIVTDNYYKDFHVLHILRTTTPVADAFKRREPFTWLNGKWRRK